MEPTRTDYLVGTLGAHAIAATYQCGHCNSETSTRTDDLGIVHVAVHHDDGCPVLTGALSSALDVARAVASIPDTFRP
ncbi:hypothetical protein [Streptomyces sp. NBC_01236]|uniref:hypothetical protein n=1 Tax=Streptomyces sp. NBC_01236 TaxID=2903789 RepID=UPI002E0EA4B6|nr:hypothetical protein OG324_29375 [Streptomyces sp. NBC_01236]